MFAICIFHLAILLYIGVETKYCQTLIITSFIIMIMVEIMIKLPLVVYFQQPSSQGMLTYAVWHWHRNIAKAKAKFFPLQPSHMLPLAQETCFYLPCIWGPAILTSEKYLNGWANDEKYCLQQLQGVAISLPVYLLARCAHKHFCQTAMYSVAMLV